MNKPSHPAGLSRIGGNTMIYRTLRNRAAIALAASAIGLFAAAAPAFALSADAQTIVNKVTADNPNLKPICSDRAQLTTAVTAATEALAGANQINPAQAPATGKEAGRYLYFHCS
jgi:hypothetical protein